MDTFLDILLRLVTVAVVAALLVPVFALGISAFYVVPMWVSLVAVPALIVGALWAYRTYRARRQGS